MLLLWEDSLTLQLKSIFSIINSFFERMLVWFIVFTYSHLLRNVKQL